MPVIVRGRSPGFRAEVRSMVDLAAILTGPDLGSHQLRERVSERIAELLADGQVRPGSSCGIAEKADPVATRTLELDRGPTLAPVRFELPTGDREVRPGSSCGVAEKAETVAPQLGPSASDWLRAAKLSQRPTRD